MDYQGPDVNVFNLQNYEHEVDSDITIAAGERPENYSKYNQSSKTSPAQTLQNYRYKPTRYSDSSPRVTRNMFQESNLLDDAYSYDDEEDEDYYPSDGDTDEEDESVQKGVIQIIKPEVTAIEKVVILSTFIGTALGIVIGYILFLSENEQ